LDHKREGKKFIPPFTHKLGSLQEVSWVRTMLPEFLWIALIQNYYGMHEGVEIITTMTRITRECSPSEKLRIFATISSFGEMKPEEYLCLQGELAASGELFKVQKALLPLIVFYPDCPMRFSFSTKPSFKDSTDQHLERFKTLVHGLYDKYSRDTMMVLATAIWLAFDSGVLNVFEGLALASFPEIEKYPHTELSQKVAGSIRTSIHMFFTEPHYSASSNWPRYFWNRGLEIDRCTFEEEINE
jgi:hypothetical protein